MNPEHERLKEILLEAAAKGSGAERAAYLVGACRADPQLRARVEALLEAHDQAEGFLIEPAVPSPQQTTLLTTPVTERPGDRIGRYTLLEPIGEGGFGIVYVAEQREPLKGHCQRVTPACFSPNGRFILTGSADGTAKIWRTPLTTTNEPFARHGGWFAKCAYSPDGRWLLLDDGIRQQTTLWDAGSRRQLATLDLTGTATGFSADGRMLAGFDHNGQLAIWTLTGDGPCQNTTSSKPPSAQLFPIFARDGRTLAFRSGTDSVLIWDWRQGQPVATLQEGLPPQTVSFFAFYPDGKTLVTGCADGTLRFWETAGWTRAELVPAKSELVYAHAFSPDSRCLATAGQTPTVRLWEVARQTAEDLPTGAGPAHSLAFAPDGRTLAVGTRDGLIQLWNVPSGREITELNAHSSIVCSLAFSPDGRTLATVGIDGTLRLWDAPTFAETDGSPERAQVREGWSGGGSI